MDSQALALTVPAHFLPGDKVLEFLAPESDWLDIRYCAEDDDDTEAEIVRGYCAAVRAALTDDGRPPLAAAGLKLHDRLAKIAASLDGVSARAKELPAGLRKLAALLHRGLDETAALWPPVRAAFKWVRRVARILKNKAQLPARKVRRQLTRVLSRIRREAMRDPKASVRSQLRHFAKVTKSYWPGLFACHDSRDIPRTNNDLEHLFGSHRYHERRSSGRRRASPGLVVRGSVRVVSGVATRLHPGAGLRLPPDFLENWRKSRADLESRREARRQQGRFRKDPDGYLNTLENKCFQLGLPS